MLEKHWRHGSHPLQGSCLDTTVLWERRARVNGDNTTGDNDLALDAGRIVPVVVREELGAVDDGLVVDVGAAQVGLRRRVVDAGVAPVEVVPRALVNHAGIGDDSVDALPLGPDGLEELQLRGVRLDVALNEEHRPTRRVELRCESLALLDAAACDGEVVATCVQALSQVTTDTTLMNFINLFAQIWKSGLHLRLHQ